MRISLMMAAWWLLREFVIDWDDHGASSPSWHSKSSRTEGRSPSSTNRSDIRGTSSWTSGEKRPQPRATPVAPVFARRTTRGTPPLTGHLHRPRGLLSVGRMPKLSSWIRKLIDGIPAAGPSIFPKRTSNCCRSKSLFILPILTTSNHLQSLISRPWTSQNHKSLMSCSTAPGNSIKLTIFYIATGSHGSFLQYYLLNILVFHNYVEIPDGDFIHCVFRNSGPYNGGTAPGHTL